MNRKKIMFYAVGPVGSAVLGFVSLPVITWFYSVEDIGRISMLQVAAGFLVLLFSLGLDQAYVREYHERKIKAGLFRVSFFPGLILMVFSFSVVALIDIRLLSKFLYDISSDYLACISVGCFVLALTSRFLSLILRMEERALAYSMSQVLPKVFFLCFILSTVWLGWGQNTNTLIAAHAASIMAVFLIFAWNTRKEWLDALSCEIDTKELRSLLAFGLPLVIGGVAAWGLKFMDKLFLRGMSSFAELGIYSVAVSIAGVATIFAGIFNTIWAPMIYKWVSQGEDLRKIDDISEWLLAAIYFAVVFSGLFSWTIPYFLPSEYSRIQYLITPCLLGPLFYTLSEATGIGINVSRKTSLSMVAAIVAMLCGAVGNYFLVPSYGAAGAATSTAIAFWAFYILRTEISSKVWRAVPRGKSHFVGSVLLFAALIGLFAGDPFMLYLIWGFLFFLGFVIFSGLVKRVCLALGFA